MLGTLLSKRNVNTEEFYVFGSEGLLGRYVVAAALENGYRVIGIDIAENTMHKSPNFIYRKINILSACESKDISEFLKGLIDIDNSIGFINCMLIPFKKGSDYLAVIDGCTKLFAVDYYLTNSIVELITTKKRKKHFKCLLISSIKSRRPPKFWQYEGTNMQSPTIYGAMKAAVNYLIQDFASRYRNTNVSFTAIAPAGILGEEHDQKFLERYNSSVSDGGLVPPSIIAEQIMALLKAGPYVNGVTIDIDAGWQVIDGSRI